MAVVLCLLYWRMSMTQPVNSDNAANALEAWSMLHGNVLLHGWWLPDVSFATTELPQYMLAEAVGGLGPWVVHVCAAITYTLVVLAVAAAARGRATGREGLVRALLAGGVVAAPQISGGAILLLGPDHTGTVVPALLTLLLIDRCSPATAPAAAPAPATTRVRVREWWFVPAVVCLVLTWTMIADNIVLLTVIVPLAVTAIARACHGWLRHTGNAASRAYELAAAGAGVIAGVLGEYAPRAIVAMGGYHIWPYTTRREPLGALPAGAWNTVQGLLQLFGADVSAGQSPAERVFAVLHLAGVLLAACGLVIGLTWFFRAGELLVPVVAAAVVLNLGAFWLSIHSSNLASIREMVAVMPFGAVLAGRTLAGPLCRITVRPVTVRIAGAAVAAGYLASLGFAAAQPSVPAANQGLANWLSAHGLHDGLATYWEASSTTLDTGDRVVVDGVKVIGGGRLGEYNWAVDTAGFDPARHNATFVIAGGPAAVPGTEADAVRTFGRPADTYQVDGYTIMVWRTNLLRELGLVHG